MGQDVYVSTGQSITTDFNNQATIYTRPMRVQGANYARVELVVHHIFASAGNTVLTWTILLSNDGENWLDDATLTDNTSAEGTRQVLGDVLSAYIRVKYHLAAGTQTGDYGSVCFDFNVHLLQK